MKRLTIYVALFLAWLVFLVAPALVMPLAFAAYAALCLLILWSAIAYRRRGWGFGLVVGLLLLTMPLWIQYLYHASEPWAVWPKAWNRPAANDPVDHQPKQMLGEENPLWRTSDNWIDLRRAVSFMEGRNPLPQPGLNRLGTTRRKS